MQLCVFAHILTRVYNYIDCMLYFCRERPHQETDWADSLVSFLVYEYSHTLLCILFALFSYFMAFRLTD